MDKIRAKRVLPKCQCKKDCVGWEYDIFLMGVVLSSENTIIILIFCLSLCWQVRKYTQQSTAALLTSLLILFAKSSSQLALHAHTSKHGVSRAAEVRIYGKWFPIKRDFLWKHSFSAPSLVLWTDNKPCDNGGEDRGRSSAFRLVQPRCYSLFCNIKEIQTINTFLVSLNLA